MAPLNAALARTPESLRSDAQAGSAQAQFALALAYRYGLNTPPDPVESATWRDRAFASRGYTQVTSYTAAFNGQPSRVNLINVPRYELTPAMAEPAEACAAALAAALPSPAESAACGGQGNFLDFSDRWRRARR